MSKPTKLYILDVLLGCSTVDEQYFYIYQLLNPSWQTVAFPMLSLSEIC